MSAPISGADPPQLDWDRWTEILKQYGAATGLVVSLYDNELERRIGPLINSRLARELAVTSLWDPDGPGSLLERETVQRAMSADRLETETFCTEMNVHALPLKMHDRMQGAIVFGWVFGSFPSALANDRIARELSVSPATLWRHVRLESPISPARMAIFGDLLKSLVESNVHQTEAIEELQALSRMRDAFLARVSHELRTPLTAISLRIEALLIGALDDPAYIRGVLQGMQSSVWEEARLIEDLIDAGRTRTGQLSIKREPAQLAPILSAAIAAIEPQAEKVDIRLYACGVDLDADLSIYADEIRLQQVFWNLLSNAVKFTSPGGEVRVELTATEEEYCVTVADTGVGIETEFLANVFDAFAKRGSKNEKGLGLGLTIAKHIVQLHGGTIDASSPGAGKGTIFTVRLPRGIPPSSTESN